MGPIEFLNIEKFSPTKAELVETVNKSRAIVIRGIDDVKGYQAAQDARVSLKKIRVQIQKTGKELRANALAFQKAVISQEKEFVEMIEPEESRLQEMQKIIDEEKEINKRRPLLPERRAKLQEVSILPDDAFLLSLDDAAFSEYYNQKKSDFLLLKERQMQEEQQKLEAEKRKVEEEKLAINREKQRQAEMERVRIETEERTKKQMEEKAKQEEQQKKLDEERRIQTEKENQAKLEKQAKYQDFLQRHGYDEKTKGEFFIQKQGNTVTLFKKIDSITLL